MKKFIYIILLTISVQVISSCTEEKVEPTNVSGGVTAPAPSDPK